MSDAAVAFQGPILYHSDRFLLRTSQRTTEALGIPTEFITKAVLLSVVIIFFISSRSCWGNPFLRRRRRRKTWIFPCNLSSQLRTARPPCLWSELQREKGEREIPALPFEVIDSAKRRVLFTKPFQFRSDHLRVKLRSCIVRACCTPQSHLRLFVVSMAAGAGAFCRCLLHFTFPPRVRCLSQQLLEGASTLPI